MIIEKLGQTWNPSGIRICELYIFIKYSELSSRELASLAISRTLKVCLFSDRLNNNQCAKVMTHTRKTQMRSESQRTPRLSLFIYVCVLYSLRQIE